MENFLSKTSFKVFLIIGIVHLVYHPSRLLIKHFEPAGYPTYLVLFTFVLIFSYFKAHKVLVDTSTSKNEQFWQYFCLIMAIIMQFSQQYQYLQEFDPKSFNVQYSSGDQFTDFLYFSTSTISTVGFGDITPISASAKYLTSIEILTGIIFLILMLANFNLFFKLPPEE